MVASDFSELIIIAEQAWKAADHLLAVTFPVVQDPKLLLRALEYLDKATRNTISVILKREFLFKRIRLSKEGQKNMDVFFKSCVKTYDISSEDANLLQELLVLGKRHKSAGVEFSQKGKMIILDDDIGKVTISLEQLSGISGAVRRLQLSLHEHFKV
ncbi:hypothetical protein COU54_05680 [Candidatus Pacearchaeota archaeon CG10_big_fil_rev_8_21_14_0_10_31_24]|nr:MAG: hypothetical protein COU54_05680 [Candidatus Pacearchaeota archaeon CG10_big_fil_rev_8_21_14_0_10_31_24]